MKPSPAMPGLPGDEVATQPSIPVFVRREYGNQRVYLLDSDPAARAVVALSGKLTLTERDATHLVTLGLTLRTVADPKCPAAPVWDVSKLFA